MIDLLQSLGMNRLEAEIYIFLLQQPDPVTAYRAAQVLGKPTANVYKAVDSLVRKGAVMVDEGQTRLLRPAPAEEFLGQLEAGFHARTQQAASMLSELQTMESDGGIYHLESADLVIERCCAMLKGAVKIAVLDAFPIALGAVLPAVEDAVGRGVDVYLQTYSDEDVPGAHVARTDRSEEILAHWNCQQLNLSVDSEEILLALLHNDLSDVHRAIWTRGLYLSCITHIGLLREHTFHAIAARKEQAGFPTEVRRMIEDQPFFHAATAPGQQKLFERYGVIH